MQKMTLDEEAKTVGTRMLDRISESSFAKIDAENYGIREFVRFASEKLASGSILLDAGAGKTPYKVFFSNINYIAVDLFRKGKVKLNVIASVDSLPFIDNSVDAILCTQVLEHVKYPEKVLQEFHRTLKVDGELFMTVPQGAGLHERPHDYFRFTSYALDFLFKKTGFNIVFIKPRGGYYWYIGDRLRMFPWFIKSKVIKYLISPLFYVIIPLICFYLDPSDEGKNLTLGYSCFCKKR
jgi:ubiquinone/menaquinone biosynthesis C-methylase UbiE